jgi:hypothetical protein
MSMNNYDAGSTVTLSVSFLDQTQTPPAPINPVTVTLRVLDPNNNEQIISTGFTNASVGQFSTTIDCLTPGVWFYRWEAGGNIDAASDNLFVVNSTPFKDAA